jgi:hypothetical protein
MMVYVMDLFCYSFQIFALDFMFLVDDPEALKISPFLLNWAWTIGRMGMLPSQQGLSLVQPHRITRSHIQMPSYKPFKHHIGTLRLVISHHPTPFHRHVLVFT